MTMLEKVARIIARGEYGDDVDDVWHNYVDDAREVLDMIKLRLREALLEHEPLAGPYIHDIIRAVDAELSGAPNDEPAP